MPNESTAGRVAAIWRYPIKSMSGEEIEEGQVTMEGLAGDRVYAVREPGTDKVASAKLPKRWGSLLGLQASFVEPPGDNGPPPPVRITFPDGTTATSGDGDVDGALSNLLDRAVKLDHIRPEAPSVDRLDPFAEEETIADIGALMMNGRFSDYAALHLFTTSTLARLQELYPDGRFEIRRFRPNLVVDTGGARDGFVENDWVGRTLAIGERVRLRITDPTPRCSIPTLAQGDLPRDPGILRTIAANNRVPIPVLEGEVMASAGVYAFVVRGGRVLRGDAVRIE